MEMKFTRDESAPGSDQNIDIVSAVEEFNVLNSKDLSKIVKDSENFTLNWKTEDGGLKQIDIEKLVTCLPSHLIAVLLSPNNGERDMAYVLSGVRFLHTLSDVATRNPRLEQILLDDVKFVEQIMDLVFYCLIVLSLKYQENNIETAAILHATLGACLFHVLIGYISSQYNELALVLLAHPRVEKFLESAFGSLHQNTRLFTQKLLEISEKVKNDNSNLLNATKTALFFSQQCETSLQFLLSLCQQKPFRDRVLRNKELCKNGAILSLARTILKLNLPDCMKDCNEIIASISRLKSKILTVLLQLCEAETISYLDEVAGEPRSMQLGQSVALEFLNILKNAFKREDPEPENKIMNIPRGFLLINALRLVDIFSDDSNFRFSFMTSTVPFMTEILATSHEKFISTWCSINLPIIEEDANLEYDPFNASTFASTLLKSSSPVEPSSPVGPSSPFKEDNNNKYGCQLSVTSMPPVTYAQLRTSCIVKIIANLHIFVPNICEEHEKDLFARQFHKHLIHDRPFSFDEVTVCKNLDSLIGYVKSLTPSLLNEDDVQLLRVFTNTMKGLCNFKDAKPELQNTEGTDNYIPLLGGVNLHNLQLQDKMDLDLLTVTGDSGRDSDPNDDERFEVSNSNSYSNSQEQKKKRKRNIMNDVQIRLIERALLQEPDMQRHAASLQKWADTLSTKGQEITASQLKNWLNNRKARLARVAAKDINPNEDSQPFNDPFKSEPDPLAMKPVPLTVKPDPLTIKPGPLEFGMAVSVLDREGITEIGRGKVLQVEGKWQGKALLDADLIVVHITDLKVDKQKEILHPSDVTGHTFEQVASKNGAFTVAWDTSKVVPLFREF